MKVRYTVSYVYVNLLFLGEIIAPPLLVVLAVFVDLRSRRGFGLALLALATVGYSLWHVAPAEQALLQAPASEHNLLAIGLFLDLLSCGYLTLLLWIGTVVEVSLDRQRKWLIALVVEAALAGVVVPAALLLNLGVAKAALVPLVLLVPMVTALAYGVVRSAKPTPRPETAPGELTSAAGSGIPQPSSRLRPQPEAQYRGSVIAVRILSVIMLLIVSFLIASAVAGLIRTPWYTFPAGTSPDTIGLSHGVSTLFSMLLGVPASVVVIVVGHVALVILRRIPHRSPRTSPRRVALNVLLVAGRVTAYLAVADQLYYWVIFYRTNGLG